MESPFKILLVEDNNALGENIRDILEMNGYAVVNFSHGKDALLSVQNNHFDVALIDIQLPDTAGTELVEKIAALSPATRYIYITGHATTDSTISAIKQKNVVSYEVKPLDIDRLLLTLQQTKITIRTEASLKESEKCLRQSQEVGHIGSWHWYLDTGKIFWSEETYRILGFLPDEIEPTYELFLERIHPEDVELLKKAVNDSLHFKTPFNIEYRIIRKDGRERVAHAIGEVHFDGNEKPKKMFGLFQDITERKKTEETLKKLNAELEQRVNERTMELEEKHRKLREELIIRRNIEDELRKIFELSVDMICVADIAKGYFIKLNPSFEKILGYTNEELLSKPILDFVHPDDKQKTIHVIEEMLSRGTRIINFENRYICKNGSYKWLMWTANPLQEKGITYAVARDITGKKLAEEELRRHRNQLESLVAERTAELTKLNEGLQQEVAERTQAEEKLRKSEEKYRRLVENLRDNYFFFTRDATGIFTYISPSIKNILGYTQEEFHTSYFEYLTDNPANNNAIQCSALSREGIKQPPYELEIYHKDGSIRILQLQEVPVFDHEKKVLSIEGIAKDITGIKISQSQLIFLADHDPLTCLFNRRRFKKELERCLLEAQRNHSNGALLFLDLDNFKYVNDTLGHQYGDKLLIKLANILNERLRQTDILARLGGDEFAVILPHTEEKQAMCISKQLVDLTRNCLMLDGLNPLHITVSIGIAMFPAHGENAETLLANADMAMYRAKEEGRDRGCIFSLEHKIHIETQYDWKRRITIALEQNNFVLYLQPIVSVKTRKTIGYESLLRLTEQNNGLIPPLKFLNIAERFGLIHEIDRWVITNAIGIMRGLQLNEKNLFLEINLSGKAFSDNELLPLIRKEIDKNSINPAQLIFEITETAIIENMVKAQHFITTLTSIGCHFALDDFGSGFSSFNYLKHLSVDYLKIDGSFVKNLPHNSVDQHLVKGMVEVARGLKKLTVAEFVETKQTFQLLKEIGVDYVQGYYLGKPVPVFEVLND
ncbi:MAG: EAL domain-containing protein [Candidatus Kuenenia sp.]|nr:EAL domain-containing protein [Candidatus Kuenenia hertensis]